MLKLELSEERALLAERFERFFADESNMERVRAAEPLGFDATLLNALGNAGTLGLRTAKAAGGRGADLIDAVLLAEIGGRHLASAPLAETIVAARLLAEFGGEATASLLTSVLAGGKVATLALHAVTPGAAQIVPAGAVADAVVALEGDALFVQLRDPARTALPNHAGQPLARLMLAGDGAEGERIVLAEGAAARAAFLAGIEEWKLLTAAMLNGLARRALDFAADYAQTREQFGRPIGSFQAVAHPLADRAVDVDAAQLLCRWSVQQLALRTPVAAATVPLALWWSAKVADETARRALHTFGGYGVTLENDAQLFFRRAKGWPLALGDPAEQLAEGGRRLWLGKDAALPGAGDPGLDFEFGEDAEALAAETRDLLARITTPQSRATAGWSFESYDPDIQRQLGEAGLMHPSWPRQWGGRDAHPHAAALALSVWDEYNVTGHAQSVSHFVGATLQHCATDDLQREVLPDIGLGVKNCSLGYSEPGSGSDVFAAATSAVWDEAAQEWVINGQKMFTSGSTKTDYIFLLTRTDPDAPKHAGITMFLVPTDTPGFSVRAIPTMQEEHSATTFYTDLRIPDRYRVGEVNGGQRALAAALVLEHGSGYKPGFHKHVAAVVEWARAPGPGGKPRIENDAVLGRIARAQVLAWMIDLMAKRAMYFGVAYPNKRTAFGPMNKLFRSESYQAAMADLMDLTAPDSLFHGRDGVGWIELGHRLAQVYTIYGGTSEVHRSMIAEVGLGLPRSR